MALWKPFRGNSADLIAVEKHDGWIYFCTDNGALFFDYTDADGNLQRKQISAKDAETLCGISLDELRAEIANQNVVVLSEAQDYTDTAIANIDIPTVDLTGYATEEYVDTAIANIPEPAQPDWTQTDETAPDFIKNKPVINSNYIILVDQVNGYDYAVQMVNGNLVSFCRCLSIDVTVPPNKRGYMEGEDIDTTGMVVSAVCPDGSTRQIENYTYSPLVMTAETEQLDIQYVECGVVYTTSTTIGLKGIADVLVDFEYTPNGDGTYTLTSWSGTLNGEPSTELIVPDNDKLIV